MLIEGTAYYVKRYFCGGKHLRKHLTRSRCRAEWENLIYFRKLGIATPNIVAYGEEKRYGLLNGRAVLMTAEVNNTRDLAYLAEHRPDLFKNRTWKKRVFKQIAENLAKLHSQRFIHNDLNWRNILVTLDDKAKVYFFDIPMGRKYYLSFSRFAAKDLAYLDKLGKKYLSRTDRLRFYYYYRNITKLTALDKAVILRTFEFFKPKH